MEPQGGIFLRKPPTHPEPIYITKTPLHFMIFFSDFVTPQNRILSEGFWLFTLKMTGDSSQRHSFSLFIVAASESGEGLVCVTFILCAFYKKWQQILKQETKIIVSL